MDNSLPDIESVVLGSALIEPKSWDRIEHLMDAELFYDSRNRAVATGIIEMREKGLPVDILTVTMWLRERGTLAAAGGPAHIAGLSGKVASSANLEYHAWLLVQALLKRQMAALGGDLYRRAPQPGEDIIELLDETNTKIRQLESKISIGQKKSLAEQLADAVTKAEEAGRGPGVTVKTGIQRLDALTGGFEPGYITILGGRPGMGKTAFGTSVALGAASQGHPVLFLSLEMLDYQLMWRLISNRAMVPQKLLKSSRLTAEQWRRVVWSLEGIASLPLQVDDSADLDYKGVRQRVLSWRHRLKPGPEPLVIVDYLQLIRGDGKGDKREQIERISKQMRVLAKSERVAILELAQLSRYDKGDKPRAPDQRDLRGSGEIEEDASTILFLHADSYYGGGEDDVTEVTRQVIKDKDRFGGVGTIELRFHKDYQSFTDHSLELPAVNETMLARVHFQPGELGRDEERPF